MSHILLGLVRCPINMILFWLSVIVTVVAVYVAVRPQSQSTPMDIRDPIHSGNMSTFRARSGRDGKSSLPTCVEVAVLPSGNVTVMGLVVDFTSRMKLLSFIDIKFPVVPVSALAEAIEASGCCGIKGLEKTCFAFNLGKKVLAKLAALSPLIPTHQADTPPIWFWRVALSW